MTVRSRFLWAAVAGIGLAPGLSAQEPARLDVPRGQALAPRPEVTPNQRVANSIAEQLRQSGQLRHYTINIVYQDGTAQLTGAVADQAQREEALRLVQGVPGVERVRDHLTLTSARASTSAVAQAQAPVVTPPKSTEPGPAPRLTVPAAPGAPTEPMPIYQAPPVGPYDLTPPKMPPYAWPTYAPYNNYSRVASPTLYPYNAWPFIGPQYPYPKIPLGWRKVQLEWQDGHWWYSKHANSYDWWRLRYW